MKLLHFFIQYSSSYSPECFPFRYKWSLFTINYGKVSFQSGLMLSPFELSFNRYDSSSIFSRIRTIARNTGPRPLSHAPLPLLLSSSRATLLSYRASAYIWKMLSLPIIFSSLHSTIFTSLSCDFSTHFCFKSIQDAPRTPKFLKNRKFLQFLFLHVWENFIVQFFFLQNNFFSFSYVNFCFYHYFHTTFVSTQGQIP